MAVANPESGRDMVLVDVESDQPPTPLFMATLEIRWVTTTPVSLQKVAVLRESRVAKNRLRRESSRSGTYSPTTHLSDHTAKDHRDHSPSPSRVAVSDAGV